MNNKTSVVTRILIFSVFLLFSLVSCAEKSYKPYAEVAGTKYFGGNHNFSDAYNVFIPVWHKNNNLIFSDLRLFGRDSGSFETGIHFGYRKLYPDTKKMIGVYGSFDARKSTQDNWFNQATIGGEYWYEKLFIGGNIYKPLGETKKFVGEDIKLDKRDSRPIAITKYYEQALSGVDAELGYSFADSFTVYGGGYYFYAEDTVVTSGPKIHFAYDYRESEGRILGVLDALGIEAGVQYDKPRGVLTYVGLKFKVGLTDLESNSNIFGFERHMVELVRRDPDIVIGESQQKFYQAGSKGFYGSNEQSSGGGLLGSNLEELLEEFGLPKTATKRDVKKKYNEYAMAYHPDRCYGDDGLKKRMADEFIYYTKLRELIDNRI